MRENWKIVLASFLLLIIGLGLIVAGIVIEASGSTGEAFPPGNFYRWLIIFQVHLK